jgi:hypothetical protein
MTATTTTTTPRSARPFAANQLAFVAFGNCPSSWVLRRYFGVKAACER